MKLQTFELLRELQQRRLLRVNSCPAELAIVVLRLDTIDDHIGDRNVLLAKQLKVSLSFQDTQRFRNRHQRETCSLLVLQKLFDAIDAFIQLRQKPIDLICNRPATSKMSNDVSMLVRHSIERANHA